ncbi:hypothetical protein GCM10010123_45000 [Pilimelia anulata]|uniref:DUF6760 domain-containing protein n=1 Tax=Pilimelia anulata TaxID=53371 RepID=A0A8J3BHE8_9ACTN|nr:DUF6760 family protein [Pilimelia anulata]GGK10062.1 hypothetical protein GCM10010123_45000 [Pilimelia anulata]
MTYAADALYGEVAYVAYHLHWSRDTILDLPHAERLRYVAEVAALNTRAAEGR